MRPGEVSLAHNGVLFLDELPEFHRDVLEAMRQPLEDGVVTVARAGGTLRLPARFQLVCAMNPCRCGWRGHPSGRCTCSDKDVERYVQKLSGPLLDRIDLQIHVPSVEYESMRRKTQPESSAQVRERVDAARAVQLRRFSGTAVHCNAQMPPALIGEYCRLDSRGEALMRSAFARMGLTARSHDRILRVARTIADLDGAADIDAAHLAEAHPVPQHRPSSGLTLSLPPHALRRRGGIFCPPAPAAEPRSRSFPPICPESGGTFEIRPLPFSILLLYYMFVNVGGFRLYHLERRRVL